MAASEAAGDRPAYIPEPESALDLDPIECSGLDSQHVKWLQNYIAYCQSLLSEEQASDSPDLIMVSYLKREILRYQRLLSSEALPQSS